MMGLAVLGQNLNSPCGSSKAGMPQRWVLMQSATACKARRTASNSREARPHHLWALAAGWVNEGSWWRARLCHQNVAGRFPQM